MVSRILFLLLALVSTGSGAVINAASLSSSDVQTALSSASAGDTVVLPAGTQAWTAKVSWTAPANVTLQGAGMGSTVITDNYAANDNLLSISVSDTGVFRATGFTIQSGTGTIKDGGTWRINGPGDVRIDDVRLNATSSANYKMLLISNGLFGVMHDCVLDFVGTNAIYAYNGRRGPGGDTQGNYEWSLETGLGSDDFFVIEDCEINGSTGGSVYSTRIWDGFTAARVVVRFNDVAQAVLGETHATGHASDDRGTRAQEIYGNLCTSTLAKDPNFTMIDLGNGTGVVWGNDAVNGGSGVYKNMFRINVTRKDNTTYNQTATPGGWGYAGTNFNGTGSNWDGGTALGTNTTTGYPAIDQPGRGQGDLLTGSFPSKVNDTTGTIYWPNQALEPIYIWQNTGNIVSGWGGNYYSNASGGRVAADRDYYQQASGIQTSSSSPFDGTSGTGWGTLANRPTTCTEGVAYWATDVGDWNKSSSNPKGVQRNGADGVLYVATATDTWTLSYTPLEYPHPFRAQGVAYTGRLRFDGTGSQPVLTDGTGSVPIKTN